MANINLKVGYTVDKAGLQELDKMLDKIVVQSKLPGQEMNKELQKAASTARQLSTVLDKSFNRNLGTVNVAKFNQELLKTHLDMATIKKDLEGVANGSTAFNILGSAVLGANVQIKTANQSLEKMAITLKNTIRYGISSSIFNNFTNSFQKAYDYSKDLNKSLNDIRIVTDFSAKRMEDFAVTANEASKRLGASTLDYTNAALIYYQQGLSDEEAKARAEVTIKAANVTGQTGQEVSEQLTAVWNGYKVTAEEAELYVDKLAAVAAGTAADLEELSVGMGKVASAANLMGVDIDQLNAQLATIVSVTRQAPESVGVALKTIYARMSDIQAGLDDETTLGNYTEKMAQYGVNVLDANGKLRDMGDVIEEIGEKWTTLSREQQVALSQVMAGTRQYNNLLSLFDNWGMYTDALDMSANAMGTLQKQQDIYMESTEAHLKKLKATWQDLYDSAIDDDEINTGIDLLTNLIQTFDNFVDSFGGGIKSLAGLGSVFANVFNKQISTSIANFIENQSKMEQNAELLERKRQTIAISSSTGDINTPDKQAELAKIDTQLQYAKQIQEVESGITQEQYIQLTNLQNEIGELEKKLVLSEQEDAILLKNTLGEEKYQEYLEQNLKTSSEINEYWEFLSENTDNITKDVNEYAGAIERALQYSKKAVFAEEDLADFKKNIQNLSNSINKESAKELKYITKNLNLNKATEKRKAKILKFVQEIAAAQEKENQAVQKNADLGKQIAKNAEEREKIKMEQGQLNVEFDNTMEYAQKATNVAEKVMTVTGALSSLAMTWSSINSLFQTWTDENASFGDKITQTVMTLGMAIPSLVSAYHSLAAAQKIMNAEKAKQNALDTMEATLRQANLADMTKEQVIEEAQAILKEKNVALSEAEIASRLENVGLLKAEAAAETVDIAAKEGETVATTQLTVAHNALVASLMTNPLMWIVGAAAAVIGAISLITSAVSAHTKAVREDNDANIEEQNKKLAEIDANEKLYKQYNDLYSKYEQGAATKEDLAKATEDLVELLGKERVEVANLTGDYETLNKEIAQARRSAAEEGQKAAKSKLTSAESNVESKAREKTGYLSGNRYKINYGNISGFDDSDERQINRAILNTVPTSMLRDYRTNTNKYTGETYSYYSGFDIDFNAKNLVELYDQFKKVLDLTADESSQYYMTATERQNSEVRQAIEDWVNKMEGDVNAYKETLEEINKYTTEIQILDLNFDQITNIDEFKEGRQQLVDYLKTVEEYKNKTEEDLTKIADTYISSVSENADNLLNKIYAIDILVDKFGEKNRQKITDIVNDLNYEDLKYVIQVDDEQSLLSLDEFLTKAKEKINKYHVTASIEEELKDLNIDTDVFEEYVDTLQDMNKGADKVNATLDEYQDQAEAVALSIVKMNKAIETLNKNFEENRKIIEDGNEADYEYVKALAEVKQATEDILGIEVSNNFVKENLEQIQQLVDGDVDALDRLRIAAAQDIVANLSVNLDEKGVADALATIQSYIDNFSNQDLIIGSKLDDTEFIAAMNHMLHTSQITAAEASQILSSIGYQPSIGTTLVPKTETHHYVRTNDDTGETTSYTETDTFDLEVPIINADKTVYKGSGRQAVSYNNNANKGKSPKKSSGGGGGGNNKEPDTMDPLEKEIDRYHDVNIQLDLISNDLDKLEKQKKKLFGQDLINNLNKKLTLLNRQINTTNEKIKIAKNESQELQEQLRNKGVSFNADGTIANYAQVYASQLNYVNGLINNYNNMSAEAQEKYKDTVEQAKEDFDKFVDNINRYDDLITDMIPGLEEDIQSAIDEKIDLQIEKFDMEIEIRLNLAEAERDWNDFKKKIIDGIEDDDILGNAMAKLVDFSSYYKEDNTGIVQALRKQVDNTLAELNAMDTNGWSQVYGDNRTAALEDLEKYYKELMTNLEDVLELQKEIHESYMDMMDEAQEKFDEQIKSYEIISDLIDHDMQVISLVYGEEAYSQLARYYDKQQQNFNNQLDFQRQQVDFWRQQLDALEEGSDAWENAKEKWADAIGELNDLIENSIQNLQDKYLNAINLIFQNLNNKVTDGLGLDYIEEEWNLINQNADQYLDTINSLYEVQKLESKYLDALDQTDSISAQRQLKKIMDEELEDLRERDKLTQYDIERANKKYEIALKQIALQEAQQNKTKMRLRRDSQGNYRYEYTSDADQVGQLQSELDDMYNSLYNFDKARYQDNLNQMYSVWVEFQEKMAEAAQINDPVARSERELLLQTQYEQLINGLTEQNATVRENLHESAFDDLSRLYDIDVSNFQNMSDEEKEVLMGDLLPYWESGVQHMTEVFAGEGGFLGVCKDAFEQLHDATKDYEDGLDELENTGRIDFDSIGEGIDQNIDRTQQLISDNTELINTYEQELAAIGNVIGQLDDLIDKYNEAKNAAVAATKAAYEYWSEQQRQAAAAASKNNSGSGSGKNNSDSNDKSSSGSGSGSGSGAGDGNLVVGEAATFNGKYYYDSYGTSPIGSRYSGVTNGIIVDRITSNPYGIHIHSADGKYPDLGWIKKSQLSGYDTGGYTGTWGNDGRLALLHQKELVLNKEDTVNMLDAVNIIRNITGLLGNSVLGKLAAATSGNIGASIGNDVLEQNVHIDAQFPNVKDSREIEEALNNLVNMASMRANKRK